MKIKCLYNTGKTLMDYNKMPLGTSENTEYTELKIGKEYLVMGIILFDSHLSYLIDDGIIFTSPCQLFDLVDDKIPPNWFFKTIKKEENIYPFVEAIWGYFELCYNDKSYENLVVDDDEKETITYFKRKIEYEKYFRDLEYLKSKITKY